MAYRDHREELEAMGYSFVVDKPRRSGGWQKVKGNNRLLNSPKTNTLFELFT